MGENLFREKSVFMVKFAGYLKATRRTRGTVLRDKLDRKNLIFKSLFDFYSRSTCNRETHLLSFLYALVRLKSDDAAVMGPL